MKRYFPSSQFFSISFFTLLSKIFGFMREWFRALFFGVGERSDIFLMAYRMPFFFYKMCSEGPLSAALVPFVVDMNRQEERTYMMQVITCSMIIVQTFFLIVSVVVIIFSSKLSYFLVPGWKNINSVLEVSSLVPVLMSSMIFMSAACYLSSVLQGLSVFSAILMQPIVFNILTIIEYVVCWYFNASLMTLALCYLLNSIIIFGITWLLFRKYYSFEWNFTRSTIKRSLELIKNIASSCVTIGINEINAIIDLQYASFFGSGVVSLMSYSGLLLRLPLSIFGAGISMVLLPEFSLIKHDKKLLGHYIYKSSKILLASILPVILVMYALAPFLFSLVFRFSESHCILAARFLRFSLVGLFFFCLNRMLLNVFYALGIFDIPFYISCIAIIINIILNNILISYFGASGIILATSISAIIQSCLLIVSLRQHKIIIKK